MSWTRRLTLLCATCNACLGLPSSTQTGPPPRPNIQVDLVEREDDELIGPYRSPVSYAAEYHCEPVEGLRAIVHTESGETDSGRFVLDYPPACATVTQLVLDVMPSFDHCRAASLASTRTLACSESIGLTVTIRCDSPARRAVLHALAWLDCHEHDISVTQLGALSFHLEGCDQSLDLLCNTSQPQREWVCEPRVCDGHDLPAEDDRSTWSAGSSTLRPQW